MQIGEKVEQEDVIGPKDSIESCMYRIECLIMKENIRLDEHKVKKQYVLIRCREYAILLSVGMFVYTYVVKLEDVPQVEKLIATRARESFEYALTYAFYEKLVKSVYEWNDDLIAEEPKVELAEDIID